MGARTALIAFNVNLATDRLEVAKDVATVVRHSGGGLTDVKSMGVMLTDRGLAQVSMNLTNYQQTSIGRAFDEVRREAQRYGVDVAESEIVGLVPAAALTAETASSIRLRGDWTQKILEHRIRAGRAEPRTGTIEPGIS